MNFHDRPPGSRPTHIPFALVPELLRRDQAAVSRLAARYRWPLEVVPGYAKRQRIALADLERATNFTFTAAEIEDAERRHALAAKVARGASLPPASAAEVLGLVSHKGREDSRSSEASSHDPRRP
jgi:hypothetical protein